MSSPDLSIVIVNWKSKDYLKNCLNSLRSSCADLTLQIIVVDGASFDGCAEMLAADFPEVEFIQATENIGFGACNNLGFERVTSEMLLLLNPDTELHPGSLQLLLQGLKDYGPEGMACPRLLNTDQTLQTSCVRAFPTPLNQALDSDFLRHIFPNSKLWGTGEAFRATKPVEVEAVSGSCMLLQSKIFRQVGGFSKEFFMYGEDMDLCAKIRKAGYKIFHVPCSRVTHHGGGSSSKQFTHFSTLLIRETNMIFLRKHGRGLSSLSYRLLQGLSAAGRVTIATAASFILPKNSKGSLRQSTAKWRTVLGWTLTGECRSSRIRN